jgi:hypothetical protein
LQRSGRKAFTGVDNAAVLARLRAEIDRDKDTPRVVIFFSNGSFDGIIDAFVAEA